MKNKIEPLNKPDLEGERGKLRGCQQGFRRNNPCQSSGSDLRLLEITMQTRHASRQEVLKSLNILVVEDTDAVRNILIEVLREIGVGGRVDMAEDGLEAWKMMQDGNYDVVISDILMPRMNGLELRKLIRATARFSKLPFLIITGEVSEQIIARALESEKDGYLLKPFSSALLEKRILQLLGRANAI